MPRLPTALFLVAALSACVPTAPTVGGPAPRPVSAALASDGALRVNLSNGRVCRGGVPPEGTRYWTGSLGGCEGWSYAVRLDERTNPARYIVEVVLTALTLDAALAPVAEVTVTDPAGLSTVFASPPPRPEA